MRNKSIEKRKDYTQNINFTFSRDIKFNLDLNFPFISLFNYLWKKLIISY